MFVPAPPPYPAVLRHSSVVQTYFLPSVTPPNVRTYSWAKLNQPILMSWAGTMVNNTIILSIKGENLHPPLILCTLWISDYTGWIQSSKAFFFDLKSNRQTPVESFSWHGLLFMTKVRLRRCLPVKKKIYESPRVKLCQCGHSFSILCRIFLRPWTVDNMGGAGREEDNTVTFLKSALLQLWELKTMKIRASPYSKSSMDFPFLWTWKPQLRLPEAWNHLSDGHPRPKSSCE